MSKPSVILRCQNLVRSYAQGQGRLRVVNGVDFTLNAGEIACLVGPSGCGKSTLLQVLGLLDRPDAGTIEILGERAENVSDATRTRLRREHIGFVYQFHHLLPEFSALENVMLPQRIGGVSANDAKERAMHLLEKLGLAERVNHWPSQLSGGEQQRVAIARALANRPKLLIADEPTGNLDPVTSTHVAALLREMVESEKAAAIIATHNHDLAGRLGKMVWMQEGKLT
jgi:lipoprotein-releasing system ATP-binding protein